MDTTMKKLALATLLATSLAAHAADQLRITASHDLAAARPSETISIPWTEVQRALPGALIQRIAVKDSSGRVLAHQVTNVAPQSKDPQNIGIAYGELLFQHDFGAGEKAATFVVEKIDTIAPPFPVKAYARYVQERLDDFAWENDRIGHRTYGPALGAPAVAGSGKEVLVTSGIDIWFKRVDYPIVDRWYNKGHDHYHKDEGEGMDMYNVGKSRGCGGTGVWDGKALFPSVNYRSYKVLANGPVRAVFELTYDSWDAAGTTVTEVKRFTVDAGHQLDQIDSTFTFAGPPLKIAVGLNRNPSDKKQSPVITISKNQADGTLIQWVEQSANGAMGTAIVLPGALDYAEDELNHLVMTTVTSGKPMRYFAGGAWSRAGFIKTENEWKAAVAHAALVARHPLAVKTEAVH
jgi:hypothetical protein